MRREEFFHQREIRLHSIVRQVDVILLIHSLQFGVETSYSHILETVTLHLQPVLNLICRYVVHVACTVLPSERIRTFGTDESHQFVIFIRDEILRRQLTHRIYLVISHTALLRVGQGAIRLISSLYIVKQRTFSLRISHTEMVRTLEHKMLQIVSQPRSLSRVILRTCPHSYIRLQTRFLLIDRQIHLQSVLQRIDTGLT